MELKSTYSVDTDVRPIEYPCLMRDRDNGLIVLFAEFGYGTVVYAGDSTHKLGYCSTGWVMDSFEYKPLILTITQE